MVRQLLELQPRRRTAGIGVVGNEIAPTDVDGVHPDPHGREIDQAFRHRTRDGMADGAVLAHHVLVLEDDAGPRAIILCDVGTAYEVDDLIGFDRAGARIHGIGSDTREIVDLECGDRAIPFDADLALAAVVAGMNVGVEAFDAVGDEFDRALEKLRQRIGRHLIGINVNLDAERAADVLADDAHLPFLKAEMQGGDVLHHVRRLRALIDREPRLGDIPVGHDGARLERHASVSAEDKVGLDDLVRLGKGLVNFAGIVNTFESKIVAKRGVDHRCGRIKCGSHVRHRIQLLIRDLDLLGRVLGQGAAGRHDRRNVLHLASTPGRLRWRAAAPTSDL